MTEHGNRFVDPVDVYLIGAVDGVIDAGIKHPEHLGEAMELLLDVYLAGCSCSGGPECEACRARALLGKLEGKTDGL